MNENKVNTKQNPEQENSKPENTAQQEPRQKSEDGIHLSSDMLNEILSLGTELSHTESETLYVGNNEFVEVVGSADQRKAMFADWAGYIGEIKNPENTADNPFHKKKYAPLDEVLNTTRPVLSKFGFGFFQSPQYENDVVSVRTVLVHKSGGIISFPVMRIPVAKNDAQSVVAGVTYARRASLNPVLATYGEFDDDGNQASGVGENAPAEPQHKKGARTKKEPTEADALVAEITGTAKELLKKGVTKADFYGVVEEICGTKQYNLVTDTEKLRQVLEAAKGLGAKEDNE